jgi:hypothetical protein
MLACFHPLAEVSSIVPFSHKNYVSFDFFYMGDPLSTIVKTPHTQPSQIL